MGIVCVCVWSVLHSPRERECVCVSVCVVGSVLPSPYLPIPSFVNLHYLPRLLCEHLL